MFDHFTTLCITGLSRSEDIRLFSLLQRKKTGVFNPLIRYPPLTFFSHPLLFPLYISNRNKVSYQFSSQSDKAIEH